MQIKVEATRTFNNSYESIYWTTASGRKAHISKLSDSHLENIKEYLKGTFNMKNQLHWRTIISLEQKAREKAGVRVEQVAQEYKLTQYEVDLIVRGLTYGDNMDIYQNDAAAIVSLKNKLKDAA